MTGKEIFILDISKGPIKQDDLVYNSGTGRTYYAEKDMPASDEIFLAEPFIKDEQTGQILLHSFQFTEEAIEKIISGMLRTGEFVDIKDIAKRAHLKSNNTPNVYYLTEHLSKEHARHIALMVFGSDDDLYVKTKGTFVEIRANDKDGRRNVLQIQDDGTMSLMMPGGDIFYYPIPKCFVVVQFLIEKGYKLPKLPQMEARVSNN